MVMMVMLTHRSLFLQFVYATTIIFFPAEAICKPSPIPSISFSIELSHQPIDRCLYSHRDQFLRQFIDRSAEHDAQQVVHRNAQQLDSSIIEATACFLRCTMVDSDNELIVSGQTPILAPRPADQLADEL